MNAQEMAKAEAALWQELRAGRGEKPHEAWLRLGEFAASQGRLRRALGAWRRALEVDARGEKTAVLHEGVNTLVQVLTQQKKYFLHVNEESVRAKWLEASTQEPLVAPPKSELEAMLAEARTSLPSRAQPALDHMARCVARQALPVDLADISLCAEVREAGGANLAKAFMDFQLALYDALLNREER